MSLLQQESIVGSFPGSEQWLRAELEPKPRQIGKNLADLDNLNSARLDFAPGFYEPKLTPEMRQGLVNDDWGQLELAWKLNPSTKVVVLRPQTVIGLRPQTVIDFTAVQLSLNNLSGENDVPATKFAYQQSYSVVGAAYGLMTSRTNLFGPRIPKAVMGTDDVGGIRMVWRNGTKTVRANFGASANLRSYTYFESEHDSGVVPLNGATLSEKLAWLVDR